MGSYEGDVVAAVPQYIISLDDAREAIGMAAADSAKDARLQRFIAAATPIMEDIVGSVLSKSRVETYDGGTSQIALLWTPVISVTSVIESYGTFVRALTLQDIFAGTGMDSYGYTLDDPVSGIITRRASGAAMGFAGGRRNIQVTYVAGRAVLGANVMLATQLLIRDMWTQSQLRSPLVPGQPQSTTVIRGFAVPNMIIELCADSTRAPGMG
jgi:hypothetical protein